MRRSITGPPPKIHGARDILSGASESSSGVLVEGELHNNAQRLFDQWG